MSPCSRWANGWVSRCRPAACRCPGHDPAASRGSSRTSASSVAASSASPPRSGSWRRSPDCASSSSRRRRRSPPTRPGTTAASLHAGLYYQPGSLKARLCREGKADLEAFCEAHGIPVERTGKLVVAISTRMSWSASRRSRNEPSPTGSRARGGRPGAPARDRAACGGHPGALEPGHGHRRLPARRPGVRGRGAREGRRHRDARAP